LLLWADQLITEVLWAFLYWLDGFLGRWKKLLLLRTDLKWFCFVCCFELLFNELHVIGFLQFTLESLELLSRFELHIWHARQRHFHILFWDEISYFINKRRVNRVDVAFCPFSCEIIECLRFQDQILFEGFPSVAECYSHNAEGFTPSRLDSHRLIETLAELVTLWK